MNIIQRIRHAVTSAFARRVAINWLNFPGGMGGSSTTWNYHRYADEGFRQNPIVYACIDYIKRASAAVGFRLAMEGEVVEDKDLGTLAPLGRLFRRPNTHQSFKEFVERWSMYMQIGGMAFVHGVGLGTEVLAGRERVKAAPALYLVRPDRVEILHDGRDVTGFRVDGQHDLSTEEMTFTLYPDPIDDFGGMPPMRAAALAIDAHTNALKWNKNMLERGGLPFMILVLKGLAAMTRKSREEVQESYQEQFGGAQNAGRPLILPGDGVELKAMSQTAQELDWLAGKQDLMRDICACFGVPSILLGDPNSRTYSNYREARKALYVEKVLPDVTQLHEEMTEWLLPRYGAEGVALVKDTSLVDALQPDLDARTQRLSISGWMTVNEKRERDDLDEIVGGDDVLVPLNLAPLGEGAVPAGVEP